MKTVTFYSYKGGVGRSLALYNMAVRLSEFQKKVCVLDFDLEAPGLHFKFKSYKHSKVISGIVDYIHRFSVDNIVPNNIEDYSVTLNPANNLFMPIHFIPAGNIDSNEYWIKLSTIKWSEMFYDIDSQGVKFFLDLKAKIEKEFNPDFLLIDSRTGITDISGITLRLLADEVVILAANNAENIYGSKKIMKSLIDGSNSLFNHSPKIIFVLTRLPFTDKPVDRTKEFQTIEKRKIEIKNYLGVSDLETLVIHSDRRLEEDERHLIGYDYEEKEVSISNDYLKLFDKLTTGVLSEEEVKRFKNAKNAEKEYNKALNEKDSYLRIQHLIKALELDPSNYDYYLLLGNTYLNLNNYEKALKNYNEALRLNPNNVLTYANLSILYSSKSKTPDDITMAIHYINQAISIDNTYEFAHYRKAYIYKSILKEYDTALKYITHLLEIVNPNNSSALNFRADIYRIQNKIELAYGDIYKAIELDPNNPVYYGTLAEIKATDNKLDDFYFNLTLALTNNITAKELNTAKEVYEKFRNEERFINLMNKYNIDIEEIFNEQED